ncbi:MAG: T9SS type A sorting domain-containing protein [Bacteroidota bacterium]
MKINLLSFFLFMMCMNLCAQESIQISRSIVGSGGKVDTNETIIISSTIGEAVVGDISNSNLLLTQGFQQAEPEDFISSYQNIEWISSLTAFPNPASNQIQLNIKSNVDSEYHLHLFDAMGRLVKQQQDIQLFKRIDETISIDLTDFSTGLYFVRIVQEDGILVGNIPFIINR